MYCDNLLEWSQKVSSGLGDNLMEWFWGIYSGFGDDLMEWFRSISSEMLDKLRECDNFMECFRSISSGFGDNPAEWSGIPGAKKARRAKAAVRAEQCRAEDEAPIRRVACLSPRSIAW